MLFKFKPKTIHVDAYTKEGYVHDLFKIDHARKFKPTWWKDLPNVVPSDDSFTFHPTMKSCTGFNKLYQHGLIIPLWCDLSIEVESVDVGTYRWQFSDRITDISQHPSSQRGAYLNHKEFIHMKIASPWIIECNEDVDWVFQNPVWNHHNPHDVIMPPAVVDFKHQNETNINFFVKAREERYIVDIEAGTPMVHLIPLSERNVKLHLHHVSGDELEKIKSKHASISFRNSYNKSKKLRECPHTLM